MHVAALFIQHSPFQNPFGGVQPFAESNTYPSLPRVSCVALPSAINCIIDLHVSFAVKTGLVRTMVRDDEHHASLFSFKVNILHRPRIRLEASSHVRSPILSCRCRHG